MSSEPRGARSLLIGSLNLESPDAVFAAVGSTLGSHVRAVPDGETGERLGWIFSLAPRFAAVEALEVAPQGWGEQIDHHFDQYRPRAGVAPEDVVFGNLGYADDALASFERFDAAVRQGVLPRDVRFQVALPTAYMALMAYVDIEHRDALTPAYERALGEEIGRMLARIPAERLAIQWDIPCEVSITEGVSPPVTWSADDAAAQLGRMAALVPDGVDLGFHHCYGDPPDAETGHGKHWLEPADAGAMVRLTNAMLEHIGRRVDWVHMPVPIERDDDAYFAPLADLRLPAETELYLGLVHVEDGVEGTQRRIDTAARHVVGFGVATECGLGRIPRTEVVPTLQIHCDVQVPVRH
jgi:hypothetical protein